MRNEAGPIRRRARGLGPAVGSVGPRFEHRPPLPQPVSFFKGEREQGLRKKSGPSLVILGSKRKGDQMLAQTSYTMLPIPSILPFTLCIMYIVSLGDYVLPLRRQQIIDNYNQMLLHCT